MGGKINADFETLLNDAEESKLIAFKTNIIAYGRTMVLADKILLN